MLIKTEANLVECIDARPTACCELFTAPVAALLTAVFQIFTGSGFVLTYLTLEKQEYLISPNSLRPVVFIVALIYVISTAVAIIGVVLEKRNLVQYHITVLISIMTFTDIIAASIVLIMAIGNRWDFTHHIPKYFVDEDKFYDVLGPFWMYLGAITLHLTVVANMVFLQVFNSYTKYLQVTSR